MFLNKRQIIEAYNNGYLDAVKDQLIRYGTIQVLKDWEITDIPRYNGAWRKYTIWHHGMEWSITMHNGEVNTLGYKL